MVLLARRERRSPTHTHVFLPAAGNRWGTSVNNVGSNGNYWSSSYNTDLLLNASYFGFYSAYASMYYLSRFYGLSVRAVRSSGQK